MPHARKHGWRPDPEQEAARYLSPRRLTARVEAEVPPLAVADHRPFRSAPLYQGGVGSCFCFDLTRRFQLWNQMVRSEHFLASPRALYWAVRAQEFAGEDPEEVVAKMTDSGTFPFLGYRAVETLGFVPWGTCPYPIHDAAWKPEWIAKIVHEPPPPAVWVSAYAQRGLQTARVSSRGIDRVRAVVELLKLRAPVGFGVQVDLAFESNRGQVIKTINRHLIQGGHAISVLAVTNGAREPLADAGDVDASSLVAFDNWWEDWGDERGIGWMTAELFGSEFIDDVTAVSFVPRVT